jgi:hypothetical protein
MNLIRYYFSVGGVGFDIAGYQKAADLAGSSAKSVVSRVDSGIIGAVGEVYGIWSTPRYHYISSIKQFKAQALLDRNEYSKLWMLEEAAVIDFLQRIVEKLPKAEKFCNGRYFTLLKMIYGHDEGSTGISGAYLSSRLICRVAALNADLEIDSESIGLQFRVSDDVTSE